MVWRLDRLARSLRHLIDIADDLNRRGVHLKSITEHIDTTTPSGRFMFNILVDYPEEEEEYRIVERTTTTHQPQIERVLAAADILEMQELVRKVPVAPYVIRYAMKFTRLTRKEKGQVPEFIRDYVTWGAGPRASQNLVLAGKARAVLHGRYYVSCEDIRAVAVPVLRHRILLKPEADLEGLTTDQVIGQVLAAVEVPK